MMQSSGTTPFTMTSVMLNLDISDNVHLNISSLTLKHGKWFVSECSSQSEHQSCRLSTGHTSSPCQTGVNVYDFDERMKRNYSSAHEKKKNKLSANRQSSKLVFSPLDVWSHQITAMFIWCACLQCIFLKSDGFANLSGQCISWSTIYYVRCTSKGSSVYELQLGKNNCVAREHELLCACM